MTKRTKRTNRTQGHRDTGTQGLACLGYGAARLRDRKKDAARRAATTLEVAKSPV